MRQLQLYNCSTHKQTVSSLRLLEPIYEPLVPRAKYNVSPATSHELGLSADGPTLTFCSTNALHPDAVTSADEGTLFERLLVMRRQGAANFTSIASIDTPDPQTVFHLSQPDAPILVAMSGTNASIVLPAPSPMAASQPRRLLGPVRARPVGPERQGSAEPGQPQPRRKVGIDGLTISVAAERKRHHRLDARQPDLTASVQRRPDHRDADPRRSGDDAQPHSGLRL